MKAKTILLRIIKYIPISLLKVFMLKKLFNYSIGKNVKIGRSIINCKKVTIGDNVYIANGNVFSCYEVKIGNNTMIHSGNVFLGGSSFTIGNDSRIINNHFFDLWNDIHIGNNTWIAGKNSQFWTHGSIHTKLNNKDLSIVLKDNIYVGSSSCFSPGVKIAAINLIGLGSVVSKSFTEEQTIIGGNPAVIVKQNIDWRKNW